MERIVVGIDGSEGSQRALRWAINEARLRDARVEAVHAWHAPYVVPTPYVTSAMNDIGLFEEEARTILHHAVEREVVDGVEVAEIVACGTAADVLITESKGADLLVVGSRGRGGFAGLLLGSVSQQVAQHAPCPVVVIPARKAD